MRPTLALAILAVLALSGCNMPCCPSTAKEAGLPVRVKYPRSQPREPATAPADPVEQR